MTTKTPQPLDLATAQARRIIDYLLQLGGDANCDLDSVAEHLDRISDRLEKLEVGETPYEKLISRGMSRARHDPISGSENALAPPVEMGTLPDGTVHGTVNFGIAYQGKKGLVHGGMSAMVLDSALSMANALYTGPLVTALLAVSYHKPIALFSTVSVAARQTERDGRKVRAAGELVVDGEVAVSATALFITTGLDPRVAGRGGR